MLGLWKLGQNHARFTTSRSNGMLGLWQLGQNHARFTTTRSNHIGHPGWTRSSEFFGQLRTNKNSPKRKVLSPSGWQTMTSFAPRYNTSLSSALANVTMLRVASLLFVAKLSLSAVSLDFFLENGGYNFLVYRLVLNMTTKNCLLFTPVIVFLTRCSTNTVFW